MELFDSLWKLLFDFAVLAAIVWFTRRLTLSANRRVQTLAANWPIAQGTVEHAGPKMVGEGRAGYWVGELSYSYSVNGDYHAGVAQLPANPQLEGPQGSDSLSTRQPGPFRPGNRRAGNPGADAECGAPLTT